MDEEQTIRIGLFPEQFRGHITMIGNSALAGAQRYLLDGRTAADFYRVSTMKESGVRTFESPKTYWMAIPLSEININYNLVQNPGY